MSTRVLHSQSGAVSARYRIKCHGSRITVGDREFISATEALEDYLSQYDDVDGGARKLYSSTASDLLNPKSALHLTAERSLQTGVRDTEEELRLADVKESINESMLQLKKTVKLKAQVEDALDRSQELMDKIASEALPDKTTCPSDIGSLNTETLVNMSPVAGYDQPKPQQPAWKSKHVFSYRTPRNRRAKTVGSVDIARDLEQLNLNQAQAPTTRTNVNFNSSSRVTFREKSGRESTSPVKGLSNLDDVSQLLVDTSLSSRGGALSSDRRLRERSRSVSPSILKRERKLYEAGARSRPVPEEFQDFDVQENSAHRTPSWIESMDLSDVRDNVWKQRDFTTSRPPPSWIQDIEGSDITSAGPISSKPIKPLKLQDLLRPLPVITNSSNQDSSVNSDTINDPLPPPGLTYKDLVGNTSRLTGQPVADSDDRNNKEDSLSKKLKDLEKKTTAALTRYKERMDKEEQSLTFSPAKSGAGLPDSAAPRCSSLDTTALLAGITQPGPSDITGASPIVPQDTYNSGQVSAASSPGKQRRPQSPDTDLVLDGDRPWEKTPAYRVPVSVGEQRQESATGNNTLTGSSHPGSLEALKNMIFKLQQEASVTESDEEHSRALTQKVQQLRNEAADLGIGTGSTEKLTGDIPSLKGYDFQGEPGGQSLEKALVHLDRLKTLVQNTQKEKEEGARSRESSPVRVRPLCADMEEN